ncbi:MAG: transglycosylase SLT domain-containing protein [Cocleimonas sp.]
MPKKNILLLLLTLGTLYPSFSYSEVDNSFLMNEIALRSAKSDLSSTRKSSIVDFLKNSNEEVENVTKRTKESKKEDKEGYVKRNNIRDLSSDSSRIDQIASTGTYRKKFDSKVGIKEIKKPKAKKITKTASITRPSENFIEKPVKKLLDKVKSSSKKSKTSSKKVRYCLGGSYKALDKVTKKYAAPINKYSKKYGVSKALIKAVITAESCFNPKALSPKGAQGLMQLMPATAKRFGVTDRYNPDLNIKAGTNYLKFLLKYFKNDMIRVIAAYNAGEGAVNKYKGIPPYKETKNYVRKVATLYTLFSNGKGVLTAEALKASLLKINLPTTPEEIRRIIFVPRAMPSSRFSPYKNRLRNIARGNCANRTSTRLKKSTVVEGGDGIWQRIYNAKAGETLSQVMRKTGVHKLKIAQMNGIRPRSKLKMGQRLLVWECRK